MRKSLQACALALALSASAFAGEMQFGLTAAPTPTPTPQTMRAAVEVPTRVMSEDGTQGSLTGAVLNLIESVLALVY